MAEDSSAGRGSSPAMVWAGLAAAVILAGLGVLAGFWLPQGSPSADAGSTLTAPLAHQEGKETTGGSAAVPGNAEQPEERRPVREFPLSVADLRDTQEAPGLAMDAAGRVHLAWASKTSDTQRTLYLASAADRRLEFGDPQKLAQSGIYKSAGDGTGRGGHERRMLPRLAVGGENLLLAWCEAPANGESIRLLLAESRDGGRTFSAPQSVHQGPGARPTFTSLAANAAGQVVASWLDSRHGPQQVFAALRLPGESEFRDETRVYSGQSDQGVCPCCPTESRILADGTVLVAYRSQVDGYRDPWICRLPAGSQASFSAPLPVVAPTWKFDGCPHDGPSLAVGGDTVHLAWMDAHTGRQRVYYGRAKLEDLKFAVQELHPSGPGTQGNARLLVDAAGVVHAVWEESVAEDALPDPVPSKSSDSGKDVNRRREPTSLTGAGRAVMYASAPRGDGRFEPAVPVLARAGRFQIRPMLAAGADGPLVAAWMELDETGKRLVVTTIPAKSSAVTQAAVLSGDRLK